jgi:hypothetical protein
MRFSTLQPIFASVRWVVVQTRSTRGCVLDARRCRQARLHPLKAALPARAGF